MCIQRPALQTGKERLEVEEYTGEERVLKKPAAAPH